MLTIPRKISLVLLSCTAVLLLLALAGPDQVLAQQIFSVEFPMKAGAPNSCMTQEKGGNGTYLRCRIEVPSGIPTNLFIKSIYFTCQPGSGAACLATRECPGSGTCDRHPNPVEPVGYNLMKPGVRAVDWWGWTNGPDDATLRFDVTIGP